MAAMEHQTLVVAVVAVVTHLHLRVQEVRV
jgi:hypothetical protein